MFQCNILMYRVELALIFLRKICMLILTLLGSIIKQNCFLQHSRSFVRLLTALKSPLSIFAKPATDTTGGYITIVSKNIFTCKQNQLTIKL